MGIRSSLHYILGKLWLLVAVLLVLAAVLLSAVRLTLPYLDDYRTQIEHLIAERYNIELDVGGLNATWTFSGPALVLEDSQLEVPNHPIQELSIEETHLILNFWPSLWQRQLQFSDVVLSGVNLGIDPAQGGGGEATPAIAMLEQLMLEQLERFRVRDSRVYLHMGPLEPRAIQIDTLNWQQHPEQYQATGRFRVPEVTANHVDFILDLTGDSFADMVGSLYVAAEQLDMSPWLEQLSSQAIIERATFNLEGWLDFANGEFGEGQLHFGENQLHWQRDDESHRLTTSPTTWALQPDPEGWLLNSEPMTVTIDDKDWFIDRVLWQYQQREHLWNVRDLEILDIGPLWSLLGSPGAEIQQWFSGLEPSGLIREVQARLTPEREWQLYVSSDDLAWQPYIGIPGISGLNFELWTGRNAGYFQVQGESVQLNSPATFATAQHLSALDWQGYWSREQDGWEVWLPEARFSLPNADILQQFRLSQYGGSSPEMEWLVRGGSRGMDVLEAASLLPLQLNPELIDYLTGAMQGGELDALLMLWRGPLADFPYQAGEGVFQARALVNQLDYQFQEDWPAIVNSSAALSFRDNSLLVEAQGGQIDEVAIKSASAYFPELITDELWLEVEGAAAGDADDVAALFARSPLAEPVAEAMQQVRPEGELGGSFALAIPFFPEGELTARGEARLADQTVWFEPLQLPLTGVTGAFSFVDDRIGFSSEQAYVWDLPLDILVMGNPVPDGYDVHARVQASWEHERAQAVLDHFFLSEQFDGVLDWDADFLLELRDDEQFAYHWQMSSDLRNLTVRLPEPLRTAADEERLWQAEVQGNEELLTIHSSLDDDVRFRATLPFAAGHITAADVMLGAAAAQQLPETPAEGLEVAFQLPSASLNDWLPVFYALTAVPGQGDQAGPPLLPALTRVQGDLDELFALGQRFTDASLDGFMLEQGWLVELVANETEMQAARLVDDDTVQVVADFLNLQPGSFAPQADPLIEDRSWLDEMPPMRFNCDRCRYADGDLGQVSFNFVPADEGQQIQSLQVNRGTDLLQIQGGWRQNEQLETRIEGQFRSDDVGAMLADFGIDSVVQDSNMQLNFDLSWPGLPEQFATEHLGGAVSWHLGSGYLRDVSDGGARVFSLFSLESLVRKLSLDFRDVFARGMFYSSFGGDLLIEDGIVATDNTRMNGSAGDLEVTGQTNLSSQELNYDLAYIPKVTSSLPVLLAWMVNPPSGLAALVLDRVLHDAQVISRIEYEVRGTMSDPQVQEVGRDSVELDEEELDELEALEELQELAPEKLDALPILPQEGNDD